MKTDICRFLCLSFNNLLSRIATLCLQIRGILRDETPAEIGICWFLDKSIRLPYTEYFISISFGFFSIA